MKWVDALTAALEAVATDAALIAALGGAHLHRAGAHREPQLNSIEWFVVSTVEDENTQRLRTQWDLFAADIAIALTVEERLRALLHHRDRVVEIGGVRMWSQLEDARDLPDPEAGMIHRMLEFIHEPVRET